MTSARRSGNPSSPLPRHRIQALAHGLALLVAACATSAAPIDPPALEGGESPSPADGLYWLAAGDGTVPSTAPIRATSANEPYADEPLRALVRSATLVSQDNSNQRYHLDVRVPLDQRLVEGRRTMLVVGGQAWRQTSAGWSDDGTGSLGFLIPAADAPAVAGALGIAVHARRHPGHRLLVEFEPSAPSVELGGPAPVTLRLTNVGDVPVAFVRGGRNRAARDNQFTFHGRQNGILLADPGTSVHFGGLAARVRLEPGESHEQTVDLADWMAPSAPGLCEVLGTYALDLLDPDDDRWRTIWADHATASFTVTFTSPPDGG